MTCPQYPSRIEPRYHLHRNRNNETFVFREKQTKMATAHYEMGITQRMSVQHDVIGHALIRRRRYLRVSEVPPRTLQVIVSPHHLLLGMTRLICPETGGY